MKFDRTLKKLTCRFCSEDQSRDLPIGYQNNAMDYYQQLDVFSYR